MLHGFMSDCWGFKTRNGEKCKGYLLKMNERKQIYEGNEKQLSLFKGLSSNQKDNFI